MTDDVVWQGVKSLVWQGVKSHEQVTTVRGRLSVSIPSAERQAASDYVARRLHEAVLLIVMISRNIHRHCLQIRGAVERSIAKTSAAALNSIR